MLLNNPILSSQIYLDSIYLREIEKSEQKLRTENGITLSFYGYSSVFIYYFFFFFT